MNVLNLPRASGVYCIRCLVNGKPYIGSAVNIRSRLSGHVCQLAAGYHHSRKLQRALNKYGPGNFSVEVVELVPDPARLLEREQHWLDLTGAATRGYNVLPTAGSRLGTGRPVDGFITPDGCAVTILDIRAFAHEHGMHTAPLHGLAAGRLTSYRGWTHENAKRLERKWINAYEGFIDPSGKPVGVVTNLESFCREHGLDPSVMNKVYRGRKPSHRGWTHARSHSKRHDAKHFTTYEGFIDPRGVAVTIVNLTKFCRDNRLDHGHMFRLMHGKLKTYKGWTHRDHPPTPRKPRTLKPHRGFHDATGKEVVFTDAGKFCEANGLSTSALYRLKRGDHGSYKGWTYRQPA